MIQTYKKALPMIHFPTNKKKHRKYTTWKCFREGNCIEHYFENFPNFENEKLVVSSVWAHFPNNQDVKEKKKNSFRVKINFFSIKKVKKKYFNWFFLLKCENLENFRLEREENFVKICKLYHFCPWKIFFRLNFFFFFSRKWCSSKFRIFLFK